ncbi:NifB/NifX family molybdenum-iron cluster-binding protein [Lutibacter citreus]|uniref:NifB/NifX family molybdenum-iron cluster-binding protein n=1 Tax=Lutibacter citreus TaxID=2138210 RepID=UPI000DBE1E1D|nr:NifB/NifX family molybdenum-iron cluster-binding protein [Lutibacter citreus]
MKTIITSTGNDTKSQFDLRFGRAPYFCLIDDNNLDEIEFHNNYFPYSNNKAGVSAAEKALNLKVGKIISGEFGHQAKEVLDNNNVQIVMINNENCTVAEIIDRLKNNENLSKLISN